MARMGQGSPRTCTVLHDPTGPSAASDLAFRPRAVHTLSGGPVTHRTGRWEGSLLELEIPTGRDDRGADGGEPDAQTLRVLQAVDVFDRDRDRTASDRSRCQGMGKVFVLLIGVALVLAVVVTLNEVVSQALRGAAEGM